MTARDCSEWHGILAMHAIGRASDDDSRELAEHLDHCDQCRADAEEVRSAAAALTLLDAAQVDRLERESKVLDLPAGENGAGSQGTSPDPARQAVATDPVGRRVVGRRRQRLTVAVAAVAAAAAIVAALSLEGPSSHPGKTVALTGEQGVTASVSLTSQSWGTRATLRESGQAAGQVLTVSMRTTSGRWWVAGSYRTTGRPGTLEVQLSCAVQSNQINDVWVSNQSGRTVLAGYVA